jgi:hypothetical protein
MADERLTFAMQKFRSLISARQPSTDRTLPLSPSSIQVLDRGRGASGQDPAHPLDLELARDRDRVFELHFRPSQILGCQIVGG